MPLILAGPIVRRVEPGGASVWLALRAPRTVTLRLYAGGTTREVARGTRASVRVGEHLHIVVVTATPTAPGETLARGAHYGYDLFFAEVPGQADVPEDAPHLATPGVLLADPQRADARARLVYPGHALPGFVVPPGEAGALRIIHGSCRKAQGDGHDALTALDGILAADADDPARRPHLLLLTGDQIYADGVALPLLPLLTDAADHFLAGDRDEPLPLAGVPARALGPARRDHAVHTLAGFTTGEPGSHLLTRGEYLAMYLFLWSDVPWPDAYPMFADALPPVPGEPREVYEHLAADWESDVRRLGDFRAGLPAVRRALANVSTLMICDDHDITDDWFLDGAWCRRVLGNALGRRIVRDGLYAYALCQAWGNDPEQFAGPDGSSLLAAMDAWNGAEADPRAEAIAEWLGLPPEGTPFGGEGELPRSPHALHWHYRLDAPEWALVVLDTRTRRHYPHPNVPPGLLSDAALAEQLAAPARPRPPEVTFVVAATPVLGVNMLERFQAFNALHADDYAFDREAWSLERATYQRVLVALAALRRVVILSGDVHYGFASTLEYWDAHGPARIVDFTSSSLRNAGSGVQKALLTVAYPRLFRMLGRGEMPPIELFVWDSHAGNIQALGDAIEAIRARWVRLWRAVPRLVEVLRASSALLLPARGWPPHAFDLHPPDRRYRLRYLRDTRKPATPAALRAERGEVVAEPGLIAPGVRPSGNALSHAEHPAAGVAFPPDADAPLLERLRAFASAAIEGANDMQGRIAHSGTTLAREAILRRDAWARQWDTGLHIVGDTNLGDVRLDMATREAVQVLWWWHPDGHGNPVPATEYRVSFDPPAPADAPPLP